MKTSISGNNRVTIPRLGALACLLIVLGWATGCTSTSTAPNVRLFEWERGLGVEALAEPGMAMYRPVLLTTYAFDYALHRLRPWGYHHGLSRWKIGRAHV